MSIKAINWVFNHSKSKGARRLVLLALADRANTQGQCWPSYDDIAKRCNLSRRYAMMCIQDLIEMGEIISEDRYKDTGDQDSNLYIIAGVVNYDSPPSEQEFTTPSEQEFTRVVNYDSPKPSINHHINRSSTDDGTPGPLALLNDAFINTTKIPALVLKPRDIEAGKRLIEAGATPDDVVKACKELLNKGYKKLTGLASVENATIIQIGNRNRPAQAETFAEEW